MTSSPAAPRSRAWIGWAVVALVGAVIVVSFAWSPGDGGGGGGGGPRPTPVAVAAVVQAPITERGRYPGELDADAADVSSFYAGRLVAVHVRVGALVARGDIVAELDPVDAREQIAQAQAQAQAATADAQRAKVEADAAAVELARMAPHAGDVFSTQEVDDQRARAGATQAAVTAATARGAEARAKVQLLRKRVVESAVRAPFAGRVAERYVDPGAIVPAGARLVRLVETRLLRVRFDVPEHEVPGLGVGTALAVHVGAASVAGGAAGVPARITGVAGEVSRERRVAAMEALIEAPPDAWLPGMFAEVVVERRTIADALIVPAVAVVSRLQPDGVVETGVLIADGEVARWRAVQVVARDGDRTAIEARGAAIAAGAQVLVAGHVDLVDGNKIELAREPRGAAEPK